MIDEYFVHLPVVACQAMDVNTANMSTRPPARDPLGNGVNLYVIADAGVQPAWGHPNYTHLYPEI